jgi:ATP-binding cassette subfamily A (ABC1) protein 3
MRFFCRVHCAILSIPAVDEADQLGDRIAIMHKGKLRCCGTPLFLKSRFGVGYNIVLTKDDKGEHDFVPIQKLVQTHVSESELLSNVGTCCELTMIWIPIAIVCGVLTPYSTFFCCCFCFFAAGCFVFLTPTLSSFFRGFFFLSLSLFLAMCDTGTEISFRLPLDATPKFPAMLRALDLQKEGLGVVSYGLSVTTMEEVFLRVVHEQHVEQSATATTASAEDREVAALENGVPLSVITPPESVKLEMGKSQGPIDFTLLEARPEEQTFSRHFFAMMAKRWHYSKRDERAICCSLIVPLIILALGSALLQVPLTGIYSTVILSADVYNQPNYVPYNVFTGSGQVSPGPSIASYLTETSSVMLPFTAPISSSLDMANQLLAHRNDHKQSVYMAMAFNTSIFDVQLFANQSAAQAVPIAQNILSNMQFRNLSRNSASKITTAVRPFDWTRRERMVFENVNGIFAAITCALAMCFVPGSYCVFLVKERETKSKHLQFISGVGMLPYWAANFVWDYFCFVLVSSLMALILLAYGNANFVGSNFPVIWINFFLCGLAIIPFTYCCSFLFTSHSTSQNVMIMIYLIGGMGLTILSIVLYQFESTRNVNDTVLRYLFRLHPSFCVADTVFYLSLRTFLNLSQWDLRVSGYNFIFMAWESVAYSVLALLLEYASSRADVMSAIQGEAVPNEVAKRLTATDEKEDLDVTAERLRMQSGAADNELIRLNGLRKVYHNGKVAVNDLWYSIPRNQCFGFLGVNGAGKSSALKILTGDEVPTSGTAVLAGHDILQEPHVVRRMMGYCPQFDALHELLTAEEHLQFYARVRGVPEDMLDRMVDLLIRRLTLDQDEQHKRPAGTYSGGNKRKLSVAIALIGNPPVVFLDEPSTGMDPVSRRFMWDFLSQTMTNRAVILTTHSMEECEALCARIGILVLGKLKCLGTSQHLKTKYANGFQINLTLESESKLEAARTFLDRRFRDAEEIESFGGSVKYRIGNQHESLADIFSALEGAKQELGISNYAISQTSLEQIFITFAKQGDVQLSDAEKFVQQQQQEQQQQQQQQSLPPSDAQPKEEAKTASVVLPVTPEVVMVQPAGMISSPTSTTPVGDQHASPAPTGPDASKSVQ